MRVVRMLLRRSRVIDDRVSEGVVWQIEWRETMGGSAGETERESKGD
jgi:hypothetical protein